MESADVCTLRLSSSEDIDGRGAAAMHDRLCVATRQI
jgi:hypothetical protein